MIFRKVLTDDHDVVEPDLGETPQPALRLVGWAAQMDRVVRSRGSVRVEIGAHTREYRTFAAARTEALDRGFDALPCCTRKGAVGSCRAGLATGSDPTVEAGCRALDPLPAPCADEHRR